MLATYLTPAKMKCVYFLETDKMKFRYKNGKADGKFIWPWPGSVAHLLETLAVPRFEDYEWKSHSESVPVLG